MDYSMSSTNLANNPPLFSVIIPAFNSMAYIGDAIRSVITQHYKNWELLIVDDGSTDDTGRIAAEFASTDARISLITQENAGTAAARNRALQDASGKWIAFLDSDDELLPNCLAEYERFISAHPGTDIFSCNAHLVEQSGRRRSAFRGSHSSQEHSVTIAQALWSNPIMLPGAVVSRESMEYVKGFRAGAYNEDYDLWLRLLLAGYTHRYNPETLVLHKSVPGSKTKSYDKAVASSIEILESLDAEALETSGVIKEWTAALSGWKRCLPIAEMQTRVVQGNRRAALQILHRNKQHLEWTRVNLARYVAVVMLFPLYRRWLQR